jgi:hypothetical protein
MGVFDSLVHLPYASILLPLGVFIAIAGGCFWMLRPAQPLVMDEIEETGVGLTTANLMIGKAKNQRVAPRRKGNPVEVFVAAPDAKESTATGSVQDRSLGGLRLALYQEVPVGTVLVVRPVGAADIVPWVDIVVRSCKKSTEMPSQFEIGCEYVKAPAYAIQLLFG